MVRLQLEFEETKVKRIEHLMTLTGIRTKKEFFNNAITLFKWAIDERCLGRQIASVDENRQVYRELRMPALDEVVATSLAARQAASARA